MRDRASYEFAIASVAVALEMDGDIVREVRIDLDGMASVAGLRPLLPGG